MWGADKTYYPGRLVSEGRGGRWLVRFDDGTERQVLTDRILPVVNLWKGLSVFVKNQPDTYEAGIITGHRLSVSISFFLSFFMPFVLSDFRSFLFVY